MCIRDRRASVRALNDATAIVESGRSFVIFPEGTRYKGCLLYTSLRMWPMHWASSFTTRN